MKRRIFLIPLVFLSALMLCVSIMSSGSLRLLRVHGNSMAPSYEDGQFVLCQTAELNLIGYPVCWVQTKNGNNIIKRLIGYPGDVVSLSGGNTYVNDCFICSYQPDYDGECVFELGEDEYLFLGDNRGDSIDGRHWAEPYVSRDQIKGVIIDSQLDLREEGD